jgi:hypothetical protein
MGLERSPYVFSGQKSVRGLWTRNPEWSMMLLKEFLWVQFRNDILRGVRLFLIAFAAILIVIWAYRMLRPSYDVQGSGQLDAPAAPPAQEASQQDTPADAAPVADASSEPHGLMVPPPPPVAGAKVAKVVRPKVGVPPPPPPPAPAVTARARRAVAPSGKEFETAEPVVLLAAPAEESADAAASAPKKGVGYKSLLEADPKRVALDPSLTPQQEQTEEKPKGNRFLRAVGKIFHPSGKKETVPLTLQPKQ